MPSHRFGVMDARGTIGLVGTTMTPYLPQDNVQRFAADLRELLLSTGLSLRALQSKANYSRTALSKATSGQALPSLELTRAIARACGADISAWEGRWRDLHLALRGLLPVAVPAEPPWPDEEVADGADPESAKCARDAVTVRSRKIAKIGTRKIIGLIELRYSAQCQAAWGRFEGFGYLDHIAAHRHDVVVKIGVMRDDYSEGDFFTEEYSFDYHWSSLLCTNGRVLWAVAEILFDGDLIAVGETDKLTLP